EQNGAPQQGQQYPPQAQPYPQQAQPYPPQGQPQYVAQPVYIQQAPSNGLAVTSMVLGIVAVVFSWFWILGLPLGVAAVVTGHLGVNKSKFSGGAGNGQAVAGLVTGYIAAAFGIFLLIITIIAATTVGS